MQNDKVDDKSLSIISETFEEFICKAGDTLTLHVARSKPVDKAGTTVSI